MKERNNWKYVFQNANVAIKTMFDMGKIWLTKKEIAQVYWVKKSQIKKDLDNLVSGSDIDFTNNIKTIYNEKKDKLQTYYSLDLLLILWYKSKHFKETKFLINTNKILKEYTNKRKYRSQNIWIINWFFDKILKYFIK